MGYMLRKIPHILQRNPPHLTFLLIIQTEWPSLWQLFFQEGHCAQSVPLSVLVSMYQIEIGLLVEVRDVS